MALTSLLIAGCAGNGSAGQPTAPVTPPAGALASAAAGSNTYTGLGGYTDIYVPIYEYKANDQQLWTLQAASDQILENCMHAAGFDTFNANPGTFHAIPDRRYGVTDMSTAEQNGYDFPAAFRAMVATEPTAIPAGALPVGAELVALAGKQTASPTTNGSARPGGCEGQAQSELAPQGNYESTPEADAIASDSFNLISTDPKAVAATKAWSACMAKDGYRYTDPFGPTTQYSPYQTLTADEIATAVADVKCKQSTHLTSIWQGVEASYENQQIEQNIQELDAQLKSFDQQEANAAKILGTGTGGSGS